MSDDIQVIHGDCLTVLPTLAAGSIDAIVTDPPYGTEASKDGYGRRQNYGGVGRKIENDGDLSTLDGMLAEAGRVLARPFDLGWAASLRDQCKAAGVSYFLKQLGSHPIVDYYGDDDLREWALNQRHTVYQSPGGEPWYHATHGQPGPRAVIRVKLKDSHGGDLAELPESLRVREFPRACEPSLGGIR